MFTRPIHWGVLILAAVVVMAFASSAGAVGYWNMPTSVNQWWGYGCGPGYHAPMVLGPMSARGLVRPEMERRLPCPPRGGCCDAGCDGWPDELMTEPMSLPDVGPQRLPAPMTTTAPTSPVRSRTVGFLVQ